MTLHLSKLKEKEKNYHPRQSFINTLHTHSAQHFLSLKVISFFVLMRIIFHYCGGNSGGGEGSRVVVRVNIVCDDRCSRLSDGGGRGA